MHIVYLHQYFTPPDGVGSTRSYEMAKRLVQAGHKVTLVTSDAFFPPTYKFKQFVTQLDIDGIELKVIRVTYSNRQSYFRRIFAFFHFALLAAAVAMRVRGVDLVFATSTPLTIMIPGIAVKWRRRIPMVFEVRDQWPAVPITLGILKNPLAVSLAKWMERTAYDQSAHIIALSPTTCDGIAAIGVSAKKISIVPNCSDVEMFRAPTARREHFFNTHPHLRGKKIVAYAGTLGFANGVDYIVQLAARMKHKDPDIHFVVAGDGAKRKQLAAMARELRVYGENFWLLEPMPKTRIPSFLSAATVVCSTFIAKAAPWPNSANKVFDGMAAAKPIVINYCGWQKESLDATGAGLSLPPNDLEMAVKKLRTFLNDEVTLERAGKASGALAETQFNRNILAEKLRWTLEQAVKQRPKSEIRTASPAQQRR